MFSGYGIHLYREPATKNKNGLNKTNSWLDKELYLEELRVTLYYVYSSWIICKICVINKALWLNEKVQIVFFLLFCD